MRFLVNRKVLDKILRGKIMKLGIFKDFKGQHEVFINACKELKVKYEVIDIISCDWVENIKNSDCDGFLIKPPGRRDAWKRMYDERVYFIEKIMRKPVYPTYDEIFLYENKRVMSYWLQVNNINSPKTWVFYSKEEAKKFVETYNDYPLIFKSNIASASIGTKVLKNKTQALKLVNRIFTKFNFYNRGYTKWNKKKGIPYPMLDDKQYDNVLFQQKIDIKYEWRGVKIGESYFAHKKLLGTDGLRSGSGNANYDTPPKEVMDFIKKVCDKGNFNSMDVDFFETKEGKFQVNELQTFFGSKIQPYQMCVDGKPGRFVFDHGKWVFEEGMFNKNNSCNLRVANFINILNQ